MQAGDFCADIQSQASVYIMPNTVLQYIQASGKNHFLKPFPAENPGLFEIPHKKRAGILGKNSILQYDNMRVMIQ